MSTTPTVERLYIEVAGTNCTIGGEQCKVASVGRRQATSERYVLATSFERSVVFYVAIGNPYGDRLQYADVLHFREIESRDEFDAITGLTEVRHAMGWPTDHADDGRTPRETGYSAWRVEWGFRVGDDWMHCPTGEGCARNDADRYGGTVVRRSWIEMLP
jgi:hypothetical protein